MACIFQTWTVDHLPTSRQNLVSGRHIMHAWNDTGSERSDIRPNPGKAQSNITQCWIGSVGRSGGTQKSPRYLNVRPKFSSTPLPFFTALSSLVITHLGPGRNSTSAYVRKLCRRTRTMLPGLYVAARSAAVGRPRSGSVETGSSSIFG